MTGLNVTQAAEKVVARLDREAVAYAGYIQIEKARMIVGEALAKAYQQGIKDEGELGSGARAMPPDDEALRKALGRPAVMIHGFADEELREVFAKPGAQIRRIEPPPPLPVLDDPDFRAVAAVQIAAAMAGGMMASPGAPPCREADNIAEKAVQLADRVIAELGIE